jgi:phosphohistidine swiveling domain-containing protein
MSDLLSEKPLAVFKTKAETLNLLSTLLQKSSVEDIYIFRQRLWEQNKEDIIKAIQDNFPAKLIIVRSSALNEDTAHCSNAGYFKSILHVRSDDQQQIQAAVNEVIDSYVDKGCGHPENPVLVQSQTLGVVCSGTILNRDYKGAPYYIINYSKEDTVSVTSGLHSQSIKILQSNDTKIPTDFVKLIAAVKEIESYAPTAAALDIEFGIKSNGDIVTFQVRPLVAAQQATFEDSEIIERVTKLKRDFRRLMESKPHLAGETTLFGDMPDWNPAEIIGNSPHLLAASLYDEIITGGVWHQARTSQGYADVNPAKLVVQFGNKPYVDIRNTFNSLIPATVPDELKKKLISFYIGKLKTNPHLQDKVEFDILFTCYDLSFIRRAQELKDAGFSATEIEQLRIAILNLTNELLTNDVISDDVSQNEALETYRQQLPPLGNKPSLQAGIKRALGLLEACKQDGTLQFSRLARLGFVGKSLLKSLVEEGVIDATTYDDFLNSISTVASEFADDSKLFDSQQLSKSDFLGKYGHLRPGTYDITTPRYDATDDYFSPSAGDTSGKSTADEKTVFTLESKQHAAISQVLQQHGLNLTSQQLFDFVRSALESREYSKFLFTKSLSDAIEAIAISGKRLGFTREQLSHLDMQALKHAVSKKTEYIKTYWSAQIVENKRNYDLNNYIVLPPVVFSENDLDVVTYYDSWPSYITNKKVSGDLVFLDQDTLADITNKVVVIESADPGYDWIFTKNPAALITKYGGPASHMAIRCAESGLPAVIGAGEKLYESLTHGSSVSIDCENERIDLRGKTR